MLLDPSMLMVVMSVVASPCFSVAAFAPARSLLRHALHWPPRLRSACITRGMGRRRLAMEATNFEEYKTKRASFEPSEPRVGPTAAQTAGSTTTWPNYCEFCTSIPTIKGRDAEEDGALPPEQRGRMIRTTFKCKPSQLIVCACNLLLTDVNEILIRTHPYCISGLKGMIISLMVLMTMCRHTQIVHPILIEMVALSC